MSRIGLGWGTAAWICSWVQHKLLLNATGRSQHMRRCPCFLRKTGISDQNAQQLSRANLMTNFLHGLLLTTL